MTPQAREHLNRCYELLKTRPDPFRIVWTEAAIRDRRLFCHIAGIDPNVSRLEWDALGLDWRDAIRTRVRDLRRYLNDKTNAIDAPTNG